MAPTALRLSPEEAVAFEEADPERMESWAVFCKQYLGPRRNSERLYTCGAGRKSFHIDPYGMLSVCMSARHPSSDLRRGSFREAWDEFVPGVIGQPRLKENECTTCELLGLCGQCPGWAPFRTWVACEARVAYLCEVAHAESHAFGVQ